MSSFSTLVKTHDISEKEWLEFRREGIGGSDAGKILGLNPFGSRMELYAKKRGEVPIDQSTNDAMEWGHKLEGVVARHFQEKNHIGVRNVNRILQDDDLDFLLANPDRFLNSEDVDEDTPGVLEIKTTRERYAPLWDEKIPPHVYAQLQHYMMVTGYEWGYVAVLIGKDNYRQYRFEKDEDFIEQLAEREIEFWNEHVEAGVPPDPDGKDATSNILNELFDDPRDDVITLEEESVYQAIQTYDTLKETKDEIEEDIEALKNEVKTSIGDEAEKAIAKDPEGEGDERTVTWYKQSRRFPDKDKIKEEFPELFDDGGDWSEDYSNESDYRVFRIY